jgi:chromosome partitioning protein
MNRKQTRIVAVANEKGGVGKTVTVINLGAALAGNDNTVLIVDMDPQSAATRSLGIDMSEKRPSVYDLIMDSLSCPVGDVILSTRWKGIDIIPAHSDLAGAEVELVEADGRENRLKEALEEVNGRYDFILIDTPPSLSLLTVNVFAYAKEVLVPCQTHPFSYAALEELFDTIDAVREEINPDIRVSGVLATLYDGRTRVARNILEKLKSGDRTKTLLFDTVIRVNATVAESAEIGKPVVYYRKSSYGALDYTAFAEEFRNR